MVESRQHLDPAFLITALFIITLIGRNSVISSVAIVSVEAFIFSICDDVMDERHAAASERRHKGNGSANVGNSSLGECERRQASSCSFNSGQSIPLPIKTISYRRSPQGSSQLARI